MVSSGQITSEIQFSSLLNPDDVSIELMFQAFFDAAAKVVPVGPSSIRLPQDADASIRFRDSVNDVAIVINWPVEITRMIPMLDDLIREVRNHGDHNSRFHSQNTEWLASCLRDLTRTRRWIQEVLVGLPKRLPWLWLSILEYASPFPDKWNSTFRVQQNYLRFASLMLYRRLLNTINYVLPEFRADPPFDNERVPGASLGAQFPRSVQPRGRPRSRLRDRYRWL